jgi:hypothetical protein
MKNIINEEINKINYLFGYKRGVVISEQTNPVADTKIEYIERLKSEQPESNQSYYNNLINYYKGLDSPDADKNMIDKIDKYFSDTKIPKLPNTEEADLGNAPDNLIKSFQSILDDKNTPQEVKDWCETQKNNFGEGVCVIGVSTDRETSRKKRVSNVNQLLHHYNKNYEDTALRQDDNGLYYRLSYVYGPKS